MRNAKPRWRGDTLSEAPTPPKAEYLLGEVELLLCQQRARRAHILLGFLLRFVDLRPFLLVQIAVQVNLANMSPRLINCSIQDSLPKCTEN